MKRLTLIALLAVAANLALAAEINCIPPTTRADGTPPHHRDGTAIKAGEIPARGAYTLYEADPTQRRGSYDRCPIQVPALAGERRYYITVTDSGGRTSAPSNTVTIAGATAPPQPPVVTPPVTPPTTFGPPVNFNVTISSGTTGRINCTAAPGTKRIILFAVNANGSLGSRQQVYTACGGTFAKFSTGRTFVLKAEDATGKQSGRSNTFTIK